MLIGASEGKAWRYEVLEASEGFLVRVRDLDTGAVDEEESKLFRTATVAFAYAEMSAAFERFGQATIAGDDATELAEELQSSRTLYADVSRRLGDDGIGAQVVVAWNRRCDQSDRRRYH